MAGTPGSSDTDTIANGLAASHAYTLLSVHTIKHANKTTSRLFKMRNPWGSDGVYRGPWSDVDPVWNTAS